MAYLEKKAGLSPAHLSVLRDFSPEALRSLSIEKRIDLLMTHADLEVRRREAFWNALTAFATGALPILALLGVTKLFGKK